MMKWKGFRRKMWYAVKGEEFFLDCWAPEDGSDRLYRNAGNKLPI
jgi:hypothetical protein